MMNKTIMMALTAACLGAAQVMAVSLTASDSSGASFNAKGNWSDSAAPSADKDYEVGGTFYMRTPNAAGSLTFGGRSLTLNGANPAFTGGALVINTSRTGVEIPVITVGDLRLVSGGKIIDQARKGNDPMAWELAGNIAISGSGVIGTNLNNGITTGAMRAIVSANVKDADDAAGLLKIGYLNNAADGVNVTHVTELTGNNTYSGGTLLVASGFASRLTELSVAAGSSLGTGNVTLTPGTGKITLTLNSNMAIARDAGLIISGNAAANWSLNLGTTAGGLNFNTVEFGGKTYNGADGLTFADFILDAGAGHFTVSGINLGELATGNATYNSINQFVILGVPEPSALVLLGVGTGLLAFLRRRK